MHVQGLVGVFAGVFGSPGNVHLVKTDLVDAFATQVFVADAAAPQVALGQALQAMRQMGFKHIALQHGVVGQRNVGRLPYLGAEGDADDFGPHGVQRGGFGVHGGEFSRLQRGQPGVKGIPGEDGVAD